MGICGCTMNGRYSRVTFMGMEFIHIHISGLKTKTKTKTTPPKSKTLNNVKSVVILAPFPQWTYTSKRAMGDEVNMLFSQMKSVPNTWYRSWYSLSISQCWIWFQCVNVCSFIQCVLETWARCHEPLQVTHSRRDGIHVGGNCWGGVTESWYCIILCFKDDLRNFQGLSCF